ncbi:MAG: RagB/SusD family nutrient uptake outer membrane protein [Sphingobacteriaceae bacterium]|nr:MAG: RagB/SusD family nutrient uptake outer membrane protein [Sphingobacteriaceae bacterium]
MKNKNIYIRLFLIGILTTVIVSCKKFLIEEPLSSIGEVTAFSTVINARNAVIGVYNQLSGDTGYGSRLNLIFCYDTDEMIDAPNNGVPDNSNRDFGRYAVLPTNSILEPVFRQLYTGIERANVCIKNIPKMDAYTNGSAADKAELQRLYGEALSLRAQFYFELVRVWGDVPAQWVPSADMPDLNIPKIDRDSIYGHIIQDLKTAEEIVPWRGEAGATADQRLTKGAVKGLRARIALFRGGYSLRRETNIMERRPDYLTFYKIARDECADIMQHRSSHNLNTSFQAVFKDNLDAHKIEPTGEVMFEAVMSGGVSASDGKLGYFDGPRINGKGNGFINVLPSYFYLFNQYDTRRDVTVAAYNGNADGTKVGQSTTNLYDGKFRRDWITSPAVDINSAGQYFSVNWPILRFPDVLLMFAEAENEINQNPTAAGIAAFEEVRKRGFAGNTNQIGVTPTTYSAFFNAIIDERSLEFGSEGIRKYDLIRWNLLDTKLKAARANMTAMFNKQGVYANYPQFLYYKTASTDLIYSNSLYTAAPAATPVGYTKIAWLSALTTTFIGKVAPAFIPNHSEIMPLPQTAIAANPNLTQDYGY